jgi:biotin carboxyl carrier protein
VKAGGGFHKFVAEAGGEAIDVELELGEWPRVRARLADRSLDLEVWESEAGVYRARFGGRSLELRVTPDAGGYRVDIGPATVDVRILSRRERLDRLGPGADPQQSEVRAPMPGRVVRLLVAEGEEVRAGQGLLVLEAMKMQNEIRAPRAGVVRTLGVREGASVEANGLLVRMD